MTKTNDADRAPMHAVVMPLQVWRKMTPQEYAEQHEGFGRHVAVSQEIVVGSQEVWVFLGGSIGFVMKNSNMTSINTILKGP